MAQQDHHAKASHKKRKYERSYRNFVATDHDEHSRRDPIYGAAYKESTYVRKDGLVRLAARKARNKAHQRALALRPTVVSEREIRRATTYRLDYSQKAAERIYPLA